MKTYSHLDTQTTKTSKQNATERASSSVKNEVQERKLEKRTMEKTKRERKAIQAREDEMTNKKKKTRKHRRKPKFKVNI